MFIHIPYKLIIIIPLKNIYYEKNSTKYEFCCAHYYDPIGYLYTVSFVK